MLFQPRHSRATEVGAGLVIIGKLGFMADYVDLEAVAGAFFKKFSRSRRRSSFADAGSIN